ncbi:MAG TPA: hypothetical protein VL171_09420, partial [Verrucomicrobiae bacterium]|nr:hypothetical protein [Verrucomicrobiae bacterium]
NDNGKKQTGMKAPPRAKSNVAPVSFPFEATTLTPSLRSVSFLYEATRPFLISRRLATQPFRASFAHVSFRVTFHLNTSFRWLGTGGSSFAMASDFARRASTDKSAGRLCG